MRFLHISKIPVWPMEGKGGMPSLRETLRGHIRGGHSVVLVLPKYDLFGERPKLLSVRDDEGYEVHIAPCRWAPAMLMARRMARRLGRNRPGGGKVIPLLLRSPLSLMICLLFTGSVLLVALRLRYRHRKHFDLVYAHNQNSALAGWIIGSLFRIPNVTRLYGTFLADLMRLPLVVLRYPVAAGGFLVPHSLLICANDGTRGDEVARKLGIDMERFRFWQNGVDLPSEMPRQTREEMLSRSADRNLRSKAKWIFTCSRLSYWKRIDRIIRALRVARDTGCDCQLLVAGSGSEEDRLRRLAKELEVESDVIWVGALAHEEIWQWMHIVDAFIIANDLTNRCNPLYEAISACLPVVSVRDPSTADLLEHEVNALLADKEDVEDLGRHIYRVCTDDVQAAAMARAQSQCKEQLWSWRERMEREVCDLEALVGKQPLTLMRRA